MTEQELELALIGKLTDLKYTHRPDSHKNIYFYESDELVPDNKALFTDVLKKLMDKYRFVLHAE